MLNILVNFEIFHNGIKIYLTFNVKVGMNTILTYYFHSYLLPTFILLIFFKFFLYLIRIQWKHGGFHNETF
jgi:hypothetical protein